MQTYFLDFANICWATIMEVAAKEFPNDRQVDAHVDYRFWNDLKFTHLHAGGGSSFEENALVTVQALPAFFIQKVRVLVGPKNRVTLMNKVPPGNPGLKIVDLVGFPIRD